MKRMDGIMKILVFLLAITLLFTGVAQAAGVEDPSVPESEEVSVPVMTGGWTPASDYQITDSLKAVFEKGTEKLLGVHYTPVVYLGSQVVAGTNHAFLCQAVTVYPGAAPAFVILYLYEDLQGNVSILNIADFDIGALCTYGAETDAQ